jgi:hypothetical protein
LDLDFDRPERCDDECEWEYDSDLGRDFDLPRDDPVDI